jgi:glucokinase
MAEQQGLGQAIVADIGGTNARFALADLETLALSEQANFVCADHASLADAIASFLKPLGAAPRHAAIAVAAPVTGESIRMTNSPWSFSRAEFRADAGLENLLVLNDFEALALSLPHLAHEGLTQIGGGAPLPRGAKVVLGPGTGLGAAGLVWSPSGWIAVPGEGGHVTLASPHADQFALVERLSLGRDHVSAERVLSGPGLVELYKAVAAYRGGKAEERGPGEIVDGALAKSDPYAVEALAHFVVWLGRFAGDAALFFGARGGVYLGGGIPAKILNLLTDGDFRDAFEAKGRMRSFLSPIPIYVIGIDNAALTGAAAALSDAVRSGSPELTRA